VCPDWILNEAEDSIGDTDRVAGNPHIEAVLAPTSVIDPYGSWINLPNALLATDSLLVHATKAGFGKRAKVTTFNRYDFSGYHVGLHNGVGRDFECKGVHNNQGLWRFLFLDNSEAAALGAWFANG